jgi:hypothetical protein
MGYLFYGANKFNWDIGMWNVSKVNNMNYMFYNATVFNQDLSRWCVSTVGSNYTSFNNNSALTTAHLPQWGSCPATYDSFDTTWTTSSANETITIPLVSGVGYDFTIDW